MAQDLPRPSQRLPPLKCVQQEAVGKYRKLLPAFAQSSPLDDLARVKSSSTFDFFYIKNP